MAEFETDVNAESSTAEGSEAASSQPTSQADGQQNQGSQQQQPRGFHEHPDWQRMVASRREDRALIGQLTQRLQQIEGRQQQSGQQPLTPEEQQQFQVAATALRRLLASDPELARLLQLAKGAPEIDKRLQGIDVMQQQAARAHIDHARSVVKDMAAADGLPVDNASLKRIVQLVAAEAQTLENGNDRFSSGDMTVLAEAFNNIKPWLAGLRKPAEQNVAATKNKVRGLPPTPARGGQPAGKAVPPQVKDPRQREQQMHADARARLAELLG